jgi:hypothetical protein
MSKPLMFEDDVLPRGLVLDKSDGVFWWSRRGQPKKRKHFAVCVQSRGDTLEVSALPIVGLLGRLPSGENRMKILAMRWLVRLETNRKVFKTVFEYAQDSRMRGTCDAHWFRVSADTPDEAKTHPDVLFVLANIRHYRMTHAFRGIYFISNGHGAVKIGRTGSSLATRLSACQTGSPHELYVVAAIEEGDSQKIEKRLHKEHRDLHIRGEWFSMADDTAIRIAESLGGRRWVAASLPANSAWGTPVPAS